MLALRWKRLNLTDEIVIVGAEVLNPCTVAVRENYYRGKFGSVKAKSRREDVPLSRSVVKALLALRAGRSGVRLPKWHATQRAQPAAAGAQTSLAIS